MNNQILVFICFVGLLLSGCADPYADLAGDKELISNKDFSSEKVSEKEMRANGCGFKKLKDFEYRVVCEARDLRRDRFKQTMSVFKYFLISESYLNDLASGRKKNVNGSTSTAIGGKIVASHRYTLNSNLALHIRSLGTTLERKPEDGEAESLNFLQEIAIRYHVLVALAGDIVKVDCRFCDKTEAANMRNDILDFERSKSARNDLKDNAIKSLMMVLEEFR